jgi:hypothetical protein
MTIEPAKRVYRHRQAPVEWYFNRGELAPPDHPRQNAEFFEAATRYREHWLARHLAEYHEQEYAGARDALSQHSLEILQIVEATVLEELRVRDLHIEDTNPARRKALAIARLHIGLGILVEYFSTHPRDLSAPNHPTPLFHNGARPASNSRNR